MNLRTIKWLLFLTLVVLVWNSMSAQKLKFQHYSTDEGLRHNIGYDLLQDSKGYLWIGTDDGLSRFDGTEFTNFTTVEGLPSPYIIELEEGAEEMIWTSTFEGNLVGIKDDQVYKPEMKGKLLKGAQIHFISDKFAFLNKISPRSFSTLSYCSVDTAEVDCDRFWICTNKKKEIVVVNESTISSPSSHFKENKLNPLAVRMYKRKNGQLLFATSIGILAHENSWIFKKVYDSIINGQPVYGLTEDLLGNLWATTERRIFKISSEGAGRSYLNLLPARPLGQVRATGSGKIYMIAGWNKKLYRLDSRTYEWTDVGKALNLESTPSQLEIDQEENVWVTSDGGGVYCIYDSPFINYTSSSGLGNSFVYDIHENKNGQILAGTKGGLYRLSTQDWQEIYLPEGDFYEELIRVWKFRQNPDKELFASTSSGFYRVRKEPEMCILGETNATTFIIDGSGAMGFLNNGEFNFYKKCNDSSPLIWPISNSVQGKNSLNCLFEDSKERLWMGSDSGAIVFHRNQFREFKVEDGLPNNKINDIQQDSKGNIWFATEGGLSKYSENQGFKNFNQKDGLLSDKCRKILIDQRDWIWTASPQGLHFFDQEEIVPYNVHTGLVADDINCLFLDSKKQLWIGTSQGISMLDISKLPTAISPPKVIIQQILLNNKKVVNQEELQEIPHDSKLKLDYSALAFTDSRKLEYQYRINENSDWQLTKNRSAEFSALREGNYNFQLRAKKFNSTWSGFVSQPFIIVPPWYRTWWFRVLLAILIVGIISGLMYSRIRTVERREKEKTKINKQIAELELNALQSQMNPHFIFNSLNAIQHFVMSHNVEAANEHLSKFGKLMRMYLESSKNKFISISKEIELLKLYVGMEQLCYEDKFEFDLHIASEVYNEDIDIPTMLIQPFVENAINHGLLPMSNPGLLSIKFSLEKGSLICTIRDNGIGRKKAMEQRRQKHKDHRSRGMEITNDRVQVLNFIEDSNIQINITDMEEKGASGTLVKISFNEFGG